ITSTSISRDAQAAAQSAIPLRFRARSPRAAIPRSRGPCGQRASAYRRRPRARIESACWRVVRRQSLGNFCQYCYLLRSICEARVPTRNINLTPEQDAFIDEVQKAGEYGNASEVVRDAIRALQQRRAEEALRLDKLRLSIQQGVAALDR